MLNICPPIVIFLRGKKILERRNISDTSGEYDCQDSRTGLRPEEVRRKRMWRGTSHYCLSAKGGWE
jgi:hypothetical protein